MSDRWLHRDVVTGPLADIATATFATTDAAGWCHTHDGLRTVRFRSGHLETASGPIDDDRVWAARLGAWGDTSSAAQELRWNRTGQADGCATIVRLLDHGGTHDQPVVDLLAHVRILWGSVAKVDNGWATLHETRTGPLVVPAPQGTRTGDRLGLRSVELVTESRAQHAPGVSDAGNRAVFDELMFGFVVVEGDG